MKKFSRQSLIIGILFALMVLLALDLYLWNNFNEYLWHDIRQELSRKMSLAMNLVDTTAFRQDDRIVLKKFADEIKSLTELRTTLIDKQGWVVADSDVPYDKLANVENHIGREEVQEALRSGWGMATRTSATINKKLIYYCETFTRNGRVIGFVRFAMFAPEFKSRMNFFLKTIFQSNLILLLIGILGFLLYWLWINKNLRAVREPLIDQREMWNFQPLEHQNYEEFDRLADGINQLGLKLQEKSDLLKSEKNQVLNIFNAMAEGVAAFNSEGLPIFFNAAFLEILQLEENEIRNRPYYDWIHFPPLIQDIEKYMRDHGGLKTRTKYYGESYIEYQILPLTFDTAEETGFLVTIQDVTHLHQLETIRRDFVANVSHEFKTPLTSIRGYAETLLSGMAENPDLQNKFLNKILRQTEHLENLVGDLLQLSRVEKREVDEFESIDPLPVIREIIEEFTPLAARKKLKFESELPETGTEVLLNANTNLIHTLISNLMTNAIQYNRPNGKIVLRVKLVNDKLAIEVEDTGIGIAPDFRDRIFERFFRVEAAKEVFAEGSGLGLSIVKHIVELLNGTVSVESKPREGSLFRVELPATVKN